MLIQCDLMSSPCQQPFRSVRFSHAIRLWIRNKGGLNDSFFPKIPFKVTNLSTQRFHNSLLFMSKEMEVEQDLSVFCTK